MNETPKGGDTLDRELSESERIVAAEMQAEIRRKLASLLADSHTPASFKDAFAEIQPQKKDF